MSHENGCPPVLDIAAAKNTHIGVVEEHCEGVFEPADAPTDYVQTLQEGFELSQTKEVIERNIFTGSIGRTSPLTGQFQASGTIPTEFRAASAAGGIPEIDVLLRSGLGARKQIETVTTTKAMGNTSDTLQIENADISKFAVGDIIRVNEPGEYHVSPITNVVTTPGSASITLLIPREDEVSFSGAVQIDKVTQYNVADSGHPSFSLSKWVEGTLLEKAEGCKVNSISLENFTTGQLPQMSFGFEGLNFDREIGTIPVTPSYSSQLPPILLNGRVFLNEDIIHINELTLSIENTLGFVTSINAPNGRYSSRATERTITGTFNPYKLADNIDMFNRYKNNTPFTIFAYAKIPANNAGEFGGVVAIYLRNVLITELGEADQDGLLQESVTFSADRGASGNIPEISIAFI